MKYQVDMVFQMHKAIYVEAKSREDAIQQAWAVWDKMPAEGEYIDDSTVAAINPDYDGICELCEPEEDV